jgi:hypothetical protein
MSFRGNLLPVLLHIDVTITIQQHYQQSRVTEHHRMYPRFIMGKSLAELVFFVPFSSLWAKDLFSYLQGYQNYIFRIFTEMVSSSRGHGHLSIAVHLKILFS